MRRRCARCNRELATGQTTCICGSTQRRRTTTTLGRLTALETGTQELQQVTRTPEPKGRP